VSTKQSNALEAQGVKAVLAWAIDPSGGSASAYLDKVAFVPLPAAVRDISAKLIAKVSS
jgi:phosphate transport system substrate-binding protein